MYEKSEGAQVPLQNMKLRILLNKFEADTMVKAGLNFELTKDPMIMTYEQTLATFRNDVNCRNPPQMAQASSRGDL